jgi:hypothetical protein
MDECRERTGTTAGRPHAERSAQPSSDGPSNFTSKVKDVCAVPTSGNGKSPAHEQQTIEAWATKRFSAASCSCTRANAAVQGPLMV